MIAAENLTKRYAAFPAVQGVSFRVEPGEVVGFLGPNGAGKTTTLRMLTGFLPASEGRAVIAGHDVSSGSREVRRSVGYLPEDVPLYRDLSVTAFLTLMAGIKEVPARMVRSEVGRVIDVAGLQPVASRLISKCSKGFRQRTGLANALLGNPPVLLLDEPTSGLDPNQVVEVRDLIRHLSGEKTVLLSSHILSEVAAVCARVLIIHQGKLVASGTAEDLARRFGGGTRLMLRARGVTPELLEACSNVLSVESLDEGQYRLTVRDAESTSAILSRAVIEARGDLLELRHESVDLEAVFRQATGGSDA